MSDQTPPVTTTTDGSTPTITPAVTPPAAAVTAPPTETWDEDRAKATILAQRESEKQLRAQLTEAKKAQDKLAELEAAQLSDQEKAVKRAEEAEAKAAAATQVLQKAHLIAALAKPDLGIVDAEAAATLITGVEYDTDGKPTNLTDRVEVLLAERGFLKATGTTTTTTAAPNTNSGSGTTPVEGPKLEPEEVAMAQSLGMTPEKYAELKQVRSLADFNKLTPQT